jgi:hypothetical protein
MIYIHTLCVLICSSWQSVRKIVSPFCECRTESWITLQWSQLMCGEASIQMHAYFQNSCPVYSNCHDSMWGYILKIKIREMWLQVFTVFITSAIKVLFNLKVIFLPSLSQGLHKHLTHSVFFQVLLKQFRINPPKTRVAAFILLVMLFQKLTVLGKELLFQIF